MAASEIEKLISVVLLLLLQNFGEQKEGIRYVEDMESKLKEGSANVEGCIARFKVYEGNW
jgi:hypothetical protein